MIEGRLLSARHRSIRLERKDNRVNVALINTSRTVTNNDRARITTNRAYSDFRGLITRVVTNTTNRVDEVMISSFLKSSLLLRRLSRFLALRISNERRSIA